MLVPFFFFFNDPAPTEIYPLSLHDALPISKGDFATAERLFSQALVQAPDEPLLHYHRGIALMRQSRWREADRKSTRLNSSHHIISYAFFCLKKKRTNPVSQPAVPQFTLCSA